MVCVVCGDAGDGFHYGVLCCAGCKAFFRRTVRCKTTYTCPHGGQCEISAKYRTCCRACRFEKCIGAGMDPRALQSDRGKIARKRSDELTRSPGSNSSDGDESIGENGGRMPEPVMSLEEVQRKAAALSISISSMPLPQLLAQTKKNFRIVINFMVDARESTKREALKILQYENYARWPASADPLSGFASADLSMMGQQMRAQLVAVANNAQRCIHFQMLPRADRMTLLRAYAPSAILFTNIISSVPHEGNFVVLTDGVHVLPRKASNDSIVNNIVNVMLDDLIPKFREVNLDAAEYSCLRALTLWNPDLVGDRDSRELAKKVQEMLLVCLEMHIQNKRLQNETTAGRFGKLLLLNLSIQNATQHMRKCMQVAKHLKLIRMDEFIEQMFEDVKPTTGMFTKDSTDTVMAATAKALEQDPCTAPSSASSSPLSVTSSGVMDIQDNTRRFSGELQELLAEQQQKLAVAATCGRSAANDSTAINLGNPVRLPLFS